MARVHSIRVLLLAGTAGVAAVLGTGCASGAGGGGVRTPLGTPVITGNGRGAPAELTAAQKTKLLQDIQKDPRRLNKLTASEKRYLAEINYVLEERKRDKRDGR